MTINITIKTNSSAFINNGEGIETAKILRNLAERLDGYHQLSDGAELCLKDTDCLTVGFYRTTERHAEKIARLEEDIRIYTDSLCSCCEVDQQAADEYRELISSTEKQLAELKSDHHLL